MVYKAIEILIPPNKMDLLSGELYSLGMLGIEELSLFDDKNSKKIIAYFEKINKSSENKLIKFVKNLDGKISFKRIKKEDWANNWKQNFSPIEIVPDIYIIPSWIKKKPDFKSIILDPGIAFGTGSHPTTQMCATAIYDTIHSFNHKPSGLLDIGCGSGILGLIASRLGFSKIDSVDNDEDARITTKENFLYNKSKTRVLKTIPSKRKYDVVVSNILLNPLLEMHKTILNSVKNNGYLILSGFTTDQKDEILNKYKMKLIKNYKSGEWVALCLRK